jgi:hypothetical protein
MENENSKIKSSSLINDIRSSSQFKGISFSNYKKTDARRQLIENMKGGKLEPAAYWCGELVCAGHYMEIWEIILHYTGKHIHLGNPKIIIYLQMRFEIFKNIVSRGQYITELDLRNDPTIRKLFAEIISVLTLSNRKHSFEPIKINREEEFDMTQMTDRLKATSAHYADGLLHPKDPKELFISVNEFAYHISRDSLSTIYACYWIEWTIEFDTICRKRKQDCFCEKRTYVPVETKYQKDIIWILWDVLKHYVGELGNSFISRLFDALLMIFCIKYTTAACKRRRFLLYFAVALLTETVPNNIELMPNKAMVQNIVDKINIIYAQLQKNAVAPNTDYLFSGIQDDKDAFDRSMKKMELVNSMTGFNG